MQEKCVSQAVARDLEVEFFEILQRIDQAILAAESPDSLVRTILSDLHYPWPGRLEGLLVFDGDPREGTLLPATGNAPLTEGDTRRFRFPAPLAETGLCHGEEEFLPAGDLPDLLGSPLGAGAPYILLIPVLAGSRLFGALAFALNQMLIPGEPRLRRLKAIADQLALAFQQARLREAVAEHARDLAARAADHTAQPSERELALAAANAELQRLNVIKTQFVADVSHELRTPLANIMLYIDLLQDCKPERQAKYIRTLDREAKLLGALIEDLLSLSRLDQGSILVNAGPVNLCVIVDDLVEDRRTLLAERGLALECALDSPLPIVRADERMLNQVLTNLMSNAMNYTPRGGKITISARVSTNGLGPGVIMGVSDTGIGIKSEEQPHVFERFYRGEAARRTGAPGTGLGLAICKEIVDRHSGKIMVMSQEGEGSTFAVWLPA